jgi:HEAT repeat protein
MRSRLVAGLVAVSLAAAAPGSVLPARAHGGQYRGPAGEVPPDSRQPEDPPPPDDGGTPTPPDTGGDGTPTPPDDGGEGTPTPPDGGTPTPPDGGTGGVPQPPGTGTGGTRTGRLPAKKGPSFDSWLFWWNYNKDALLDLRRVLRTGRTASASGIGEAADVGAPGIEEDVDVTARLVEARVVPILLASARDDGLDFDIQSAAALGLAKIGRREATPLLMAQADNEGSPPRHRVVEESAALALGLLQDRSPAVRAFLGRIALDRGAKTRTRCFAAFALGLLGGPDAAPADRAESLAFLKALATDEGEADRNLAAAAFVGIGLLGEPAALPELLGWVREERAGANRLDDLRLSFAVAALGKIGRPGLAGPASREVVDALEERLTRKDRMTRYAAVIALGQVAPAADEALRADIAAGLASLARGGGRGGADAQTVHFALVSLGRVAAVSAPGSKSRARCIAALREALDGRPGARNFAALGLGLAGMGRDAGDRADLVDPVRQALAGSKGDVESRGAFCIALGLLGDPVAAPQLRAILDDRGNDPSLRGKAALALGLLGDRGATEPVRRALLEKESRDLRVDASIAAALLRDREAVPALVGILRDPKSSQTIRGSVAAALGPIGDARSVEPLAEILQDARKEYPALTRALAAVALGQIGDRRDLAVLARLSTDVNYRAYFDALGEVLTIL